jgi:hypothetical protein
MSGCLKIPLIFARVPFSCPFKTVNSFSSALAENLKMNTMSSLNGTHSVKFAMSYNSAVGRTPLISEVE